MLSARELSLERSTATEAVDRAILVGTELRSVYPQGPGRLTRPPRDDSLTFKNRSESGRVGLGKKRSWGEDVPKRGFHEFRELKIQPLPQLRPLRCVSECEDTGSIGLEEIAAFRFAA